MINSLNLLKLSAERYFFRLLKNMCRTRMLPLTIHIKWKFKKFINWRNPGRKKTSKILEISEVFSIILQDWKMMMGFFRGGWIILLYGTVGNFEKYICEHIEINEWNRYGQKSMYKVFNMETVILSCFHIFFHVPPSSSILFFLSPFFFFLF